MFCVDTAVAAPVRPSVFSREPVTVIVDNADTLCIQVAPNTCERMLELTEKLSVGPAAMPTAC